MSFSHDWHDYVACSLQYIVVVVDGRGTGYKGRKLRNPVKDNLGYWETQDQINAAKYVPPFTRLYILRLCDTRVGSGLRRTTWIPIALASGDGYAFRSVGDDCH